MSNQKRTKYNILSSFVEQVLTIAIGLLLPRILVLEYGSETNGLLGSVTQLLVYLGLFEAGVGAATLQSLYKPVANDDKDNINKILAATDKYYKRTGLVYLLALLMLCFVYPIIVKSELSYFSIFAVVFFSGIGNVILFYFQGKFKLLLQAEGKSYIITNLTTIITVTTGIMKIICILLGFSIVVVLAFAAVINLLQAIYILLYIKNKYKWINLKVVPDYAAVSQKNYVLVHQISDMIFRNTDVLLLTFFCGLKVVSVYSMYKLVTSHLDSILLIFSNGVSFSLGQTFQLDKKVYIHRIDIFESIYSIISFSLFTTALQLFLPFMEIYTSGVTDIDYIDYKLVIMFIAIALLTAIRVPMLKTIQYAGHFKLTTVQTLAEMIINIVVSVLGAYYLGIYGVLLGTIVALMYRTTDIIVYSNMKLLSRKPFKTFLIHGLNCFVLMILQVLFMYISPEIKGFLEFIIIGAISFVVNLAGYVTIQCIAFQEVRSYLFSKIIKSKK